MISVECCLDGVDRLTGLGLQCVSRVAYLLRSSLLEVGEQMEPAFDTRTLKDGFALQVENASCSDLVGLKNVVDCVVMPMQRKRVDASLMSGLRVVGIAHGTEVSGFELDVRLAVVIEDAVDK